MANYYMLGGDGKEYGPVSADQLRQWSIEGRANGQTQVRPVDGGPYTSFAEVPELNAQPGSPTIAPTGFSLPQGMMQSSAMADTGGQIKRVADVLAAGSGWIKFMAVIMYIYGGVLIICTLGIGIIFAWMPIWIGVVLWKAASKAQQAAITGAEADLSQALDRVRFFFKLQGILMIIGIVFSLIYFAIAIVAVSSGMLNHMPH